MPFLVAPGAAFLCRGAERQSTVFLSCRFWGRYLIGTTDIRFDGDLDRVEGERCRN